MVSFTSGWGSWLKTARLVRFERLLTTHPRPCLGGRVARPGASRATRALHQSIGRTLQGSFLPSDRRGRTARAYLASDLRKRDLREGLLPPGRT